MFLKIQDEWIYKIMIIFKMSEYINLSDWKFNLFKYLIRFPNIYTLYIYMNLGYILW